MTAHGTYLCAYDQLYCSPTQFSPGSSAANLANTCLVHVSASVGCAGCGEQALGRCSMISKKKKFENVLVDAFPSSHVQLHTTSLDLFSRWLEPASCML